RPGEPTMLRVAGGAVSGSLRGAAEQRAQDVVGFANGLRTASRDEHDDLRSLFGRHGVLVGDVGEVAQGNVERDRHVVETIDGDRLLPALDLADELPTEPGCLAEALLAE